MESYVLALMMGGLHALWLLVVVSAVIEFVHGWVTNWIVVKYLFHPRKPWLGIRLLWGIIPSRKAELIERIAEVAAKKIAHNEAIKEHLAEKSGGIGGFIFGEGFLGCLANAVANEYVDDFLSSGIDVKSLVIKQLSAFDEEQFEKIVVGVVKKELRFIIWAGGVLGLLFGALSGLFCWLILYS